MPTAESIKSGQDHYKVLKVSHKASTEEIQGRYKRLALQTHPDKNPNDAHASDKMAKINEAYQVLTDSATRHEFDVAFGYVKRLGQSDDAVPRNLNRHKDQNDGAGMKRRPEKWDKRGRVKGRGVERRAEEEEDDWRPYTIEPKFFMLGRRHDPEDKPDPNSRPEQELHAWQRVLMAKKSGTALVKGEIDHTKPTRATNKTFRCKARPRKPKFIKHPTVPDPYIAPIRLMERGRGKLKSQKARDLESKLVEANRRAWAANKELVMLNNEKRAFHIEERKISLARRMQPLERKIEIYQAMGHAGAELGRKTIDEFGERVDKQREARQLQAAQAKSSKSAKARVAGPNTPLSGQIEGPPIREASALVLRQQRIDAMIVAAKDTSLQARAKVQDITRKMAVLWSREGATWIKDKIVAAMEEEFEIRNLWYEKKLCWREEEPPLGDDPVKPLQLEVKYLRRTLEARATCASALADAGADADAIDRCRKGRGQYEAFKQDKKLLKYLSYENIARLKKIWGDPVLSDEWLVAEPIGRNPHHMTQISRYLLEVGAWDEAEMNDNDLNMIPLEFDETLAGAHTYAMDAARIQDKTLLEALSSRREAQTGVVAEDRILEVELADCKHSG